MSAELRQGRLSLDQVGVIAARAADGSDEHYAQLAAWPPSTSCVPRSSSNRDPSPIPAPIRRPAITTTGDDQFTWWRITLPHTEAATVEAALAAHREALIAEWKQAHDTGEHAVGGRAADAR